MHRSGAMLRTACATASSVSSSACAARSFSTLLSSRSAVSRTRLGAAAATPLASAASASASAAALPLASASLSSVMLVSVRHSSTANSFRMKKQKEWKLRLANSFSSLKTHAGCKKRFRFVSRWAIVCKHAGKHHKNYKKRFNRLRRLRPMKIVPRHLVKRLKVMMPYWRNQLAREFRWQRLAKESSVKQPSNVSFDRQRAFIEAQNARLKQQLLHPTSYFPANNDLIARGRTKKIRRTMAAREAAKLAEAGL